MVKLEISIPDGEIVLGKRITSPGKSLKDILKECSMNGLFPERLEMCNVQKNGHWGSTKESTVILPVLYLQREESRMKLVVIQEPKKDYGAYDYLWIE
jgi:hypothetical protein